MNFKDYKKTKKQDKPQSDPMDNLDAGAKMLLSNFVKDYEGKSYQEILSEIISVATKNRKEGKLSNAELDGFKAMLYPMLNGEQQKELVKIIDQLKQIWRYFWNGIKE